jgi:hypothetical protein
MQIGHGSFAMQIIAAKIPGVVCSNLKSVNRITGLERGKNCLRSFILPKFASKWSKLYTT